MDPVADQSLAPFDGLIIETDEALASFLDAFPPTASVRRIALDTEADSLHSFREKLCLIQFSSGTTHAVIDPLKIGNLQPLLGFLDRSELWMHGADFDMSLFRRTFGIVPSRILDTQVAARLCGHRQFGLAHLVQQVFGVVLSKQSQRADWGKRPIKRQMLEYAINDVRYILELADILLARLSELGRLDWFYQSCTAARDAVINRPPPDQEEAWRINGWGNLQPKGLAALRALWQWRLREAERLDRPPFKVINNEPLLEMAMQFQEGHPPELPSRFPHPPRRRFQQALDSVRKMAPEEWPKRRIHRGEPKIPEAEPRFDHLKAHRDKIGASLDIEGALIASRNVLEEIARDGRENGQLLPWQFTLMEPAIATLDQVRIPPTAPQRRRRFNGEGRRDAPAPAATAVERSAPPVEEAADRGDPANDAPGSKGG